MLFDRAPAQFHAHRCLAVRQAFYLMENTNASRTRGVSSARHRSSLRDLVPRDQHLVGRRRLRNILDARTLSPYVFQTKFLPVSAG